MLYTCSPILIGLKVTRNPGDSWEYCGKEETRLPGYEVFQLGEKPQCKERGMTEEEKDKMCQEAKAAMKRGAGEEWFEADPKRRKYFRGTGYQVRHDMLKKQTPNSEHQDISLFIYTGGTGLGKTATVAEFLKDVDYYTPPEGAKALGVYWDGYRGQKYIWIDDFDGWAIFRAMLKHLGGYQQRGEVKGSGTIIRAHTWFITADMPSKDWRWGWDPEPKNRNTLSPNQLAQWDRRVTEEYEFTAGIINEPPVPPHPTGRQPHLIRLKNGLQVQPYVVYPVPPALQELSLLAQSEQQVPLLPPALPQAPPAPAAPSEQVDILQEGVAPPPAPPSALDSVVSAFLRFGAVPLLEDPSF